MKAYELLETAHVGDHITFDNNAKGIVISADDPKSRSPYTHFGKSI